MASSEMRTVKAAGLRFSYLEEGQGPLVLLMHGFPDTAHTWDAVRPALAGAGFRAVSPFMRGYAPTEIPADGRYDAATLGGDILALIEALGEQRAVVVGHDWGASAAYAAAALGPDRVSRLFTVAIPHPGSIRPSPALLWKGRHFLSLRRKNAAAMMRKSDFAYVDTLVKRWSPAWNVPADETRHVKAAFQDPACLEAALNYYRAVGFRLPEVHRKRISVPTVSFAGDSDILTAAVHDRAASWFTGGYQVVRLSGGHFLHREAPEAFNRELLAALRS